MARWPDGPDGWKRGSASRRDRGHGTPLKYLNDQAALATLTVTVIPVPQPVARATEDFDPAAIVEDAVASLVGFGQWLVSAGIWFVIVAIPALIVVGIVLFIGIRVVRRVAPGKAKEQRPGA